MITLAAVAACITMLRLGDIFGVSITAYCTSKCLLTYSGAAGWGGNRTAVPAVFPQFRSDIAVNGSLFVFRRCTVGLESISPIRPGSPPFKLIGLVLNGVVLGIDGDMVVPVRVFAAGCISKYHTAIAGGSFTRGTGSAVKCMECRKFAGFGFAGRTVNGTVLVSTPAPVVVNVTGDLIAINADLLGLRLRGFLCGLVVLSVKTISRIKAIGPGLHIFQVTGRSSTPGTANQSPTVQSLLVRCCRFKIRIAVLFF